MNSKGQDSLPLCASQPDSCRISNLVVEVAVPSQLLVPTTAELAHSVVSIIAKTAGGSKVEKLTHRLELVSLMGGSPSSAPMPRQCLDSWFSEELPSPFGGQQALQSTDLERVQDRFALQCQPQLQAHAFDEIKVADLGNRTVDTLGAKKTVRCKSRHWCHFHLGEAMIAKRSFEHNKKIIGRAGCNMKAIFDATGAKVRLRGKGSGHLEGGKEAPVPLMLVVTCTDSGQAFKTAVRMAIEVLQGVEVQFHATCRAGDRVPCFRVAGLSPGAADCLGNLLSTIPGTSKLPQMQ